MSTLAERVRSVFIGTRLSDLETQITALGQVNEHLVNAYLEGPYQLPPQELIRQLKEYDSSAVADLLEQMGWEQLAGYGGYSEGERSRAVKDSKRMFKYSLLARWIINLWTFYGMGGNISIVPQDEAAAEPWDEFWKADRNQPITAKDRLDDISRWFLVTGERFFVFFASTQDGEATVRSLHPDQIVEIYYNPDDDQDPWFYKRQWTPAGGTSEQRTDYYADWQTFFLEKEEDVAKRWEDTRKRYRFSGELLGRDGTVACVLFVPFLQLDEESLRGWPLLAPHGTPWIRAQREFMQDRATVARGKAAFVRRYTVGGGSRAVDAVRRTLASAFQFGGAAETNPAPTAGSSEVINKALGVEELPLTTGASDAKTDGEMFGWMAGLAGGVFPHYMGLGDAYRLATATAMETPIRMQFNLYRAQLSALFRKMVRIVLQFKERYTSAAFQTYDAEVSTDRLVEADLTVITSATTALFRDVLPTASLPEEARNKITVVALQTFLDALGADDPASLIDDGMYAATGTPEAAASSAEPIDLNETLATSLLSEQDRRTYERALERQLLAALEGFEEEALLDIEANREPDYGKFAAALALVLAPLLTAAAMQAGQDAAEVAKITFDPVEALSMALDWASSYSYQLIQGLTDTTRAVVQKAMAQYVGTPGMSLQQLSDLLAPAFGEARANAIAVTETTRAYSVALDRYQAYLEDMTALRFHQVWESMKDELVCDVCGPLDGQPEEIWRPDYPDGPPAHVHCRCGKRLETIV